MNTPDVIQEQRSSLPDVVIGAAAVLLVGGSLLFEGYTIYENMQKTPVLSPKEQFIQDYRTCLANQPFDPAKGATVITRSGVTNGEHYTECPDLPDTQK